MSPMGIRGATMLIVSVLLLSGAIAQADPVEGGPVRMTPSFDSRLLEGLNGLRAEHGLTPLALSAELTDAAEEHSTQMIVDGYFAHASDGGGSFLQRLLRYYPVSDGYWSVGENLFWSTGQPDASRALTAWMESPPHRANILDPRWRQIGIAAVTSSGAPGTYGGRHVIVITTDFGVRR
jgi:uncharacterized protein YkwD